MNKVWSWRCGCWLIEDQFEKVKVLSVCGGHRQVMAHVLYLMDDRVVPESISGPLTDSASGASSA